MCQLFVLDRNFHRITKLEKTLKNRILKKCKYKCVMNAIPLLVSIKHS